MRYSQRKTVATSWALGLSVVAAFLMFAADGSTAPSRALNSCGPCTLVATLSGGGHRALLDAVASSTPPGRSQMHPFRASDRFAWRLTARSLTTAIARAELRLGTPTSPGRELLTLCAPCRLGAHGRVPLGTGLAGVLNRGVTCLHACSPAEAWPVGAYVVVIVGHPARAPLTGQLRYCAPNQYRDRNSCKPPGY